MPSIKIMANISAVPVVFCMQLPPGGSGVCACLYCMCWGKDWWRCWAIWMTGHANFQVKSVNAYSIKMFTACLVTTLCLHLIYSNGGSFFFLSLT